MGIYLWCLWYATSVLPAGEAVEVSVGPKTVSQYQINSDRKFITLYHVYIMLRWCWDAGDRTPLAQKCPSTSVLPTGEIVGVSKDNKQSP